MSAPDQLHRLALEIRNVPRAGLIAVALEAKKVAAAEGARAGGPLKGKKRRGLKLAARYDPPVTTGSGATCRIQGVSPAGWVWVTTGTKSHDIRRRKRKSDKRSKMIVDHPGTTGQGAWLRVRDEVERAMPRVFTREVQYLTFAVGCLMANDKVRIDLVADDQASKVIDKVADNAKALEDLDPEVQITSNADRVVAELRNMARTADTQLDAMARAADALGRALGPELAAKADMGSILIDLQRTGATLEEITVDADKFAGALKELDAVNTKGLESGLANTKKSLDGVHDSADQSRSVMANMVGNSAQDLGALGGAAGSAGVAIGQLAEYAADGNISLGGIAKLAGPMLAVGLASAVIADHFKTIAETKAFHKERVQGFTDALSDAVITAKELQEVLADEGDARSLMVRLADKTVDAEDAVADLVGTFEDFNDIVSGGMTDVSRWVGVQLEAARAAGATEEEMRSLQHAIVDLVDGQGTGIDVATNLNNEYRNLMLTVLAMTQATTDAGAAADEAGRDTAFYGREMDDSATSAHDAAFAQGDLTRAVDKTKTALDRIRGALDVEQAALNFQETIAGAMDATDGSAQATEAEILAVKQAIVDLGETAGTNPAIIQAQLDSVDQGDLDKVWWEVTGYYQRNPPSVTAKLTWQQNAPPTYTRPPGGSPVPQIAPPATDGGGTPVVNVYQSIPRGWRGDPLADARHAARRSGGLYQRSRR